MLSSFVRGFENALTDKECDDLIEWFERDDHIGLTKTANRTTRKDKQMWMDEKDELYKPIQKIKMDMLREYLLEFPIVYRGAQSLISPETKVQRTRPMGGGFHNFHAENSHCADANRALVWTIYLNDLPSGEGETEFLYEKIKIQPRKGMGVIFPSAWMYQHRGNPVHTHDKYITTGWYWYPQEKAIVS